MGPSRLPASPRVDALLFAALWLAFAYFHPGGGWSQNARFAQVRALVEEGRWSIDDYLVYRRPGPAGGDPQLVRAPVREGEVEIDGVRRALAWNGPEGRAVAVDGRPHPGVPLVPLERIAASGDVAFAGGHFFPNKAPGTTLLAVPPYFVLYRLESFLGLSPDRVRLLTINAWLTSAFSVGLLAALAGVVVHRLALRWAPSGSPWAARLALATAVTYGLGTLSWPYATMLHEHDPAAAGLAGSFLLLQLGPVRSGKERAVAVAAGLAAGGAALASYAAAVPVLALALYAAFRRRGGSRRGRLAAFGLGLTAPLLAALAYHAICFGGPLTTGYAFENPGFRAPAGALLGVFDGLGWGRLAAILASPYRGLFFTSPVLLLGVAGLVALLRRRDSRPEALVATATVVSFLAFNVSFNGWYGGWGVGPRYLVPALPFLALPLVVAFRRWWGVTVAAALLSIALQGLVTAVDPQAPVGDAAVFSLPGRPLWRQNPVADYEIPLFLTGRATPLVAAHPRGPLAYYRGPVSVNPTGMYEGGLYRLFPPGSPEARWNSTNAGELLFPGSRWSLLPLGLALGALLAPAWARARVESPPVSRPRSPC